MLPGLGCPERPQRKYIKEPAISDHRCTKDGSIISNPNAHPDLLVNVHIHPVVPKRRPEKSPPELKGIFSCRGDTGLGVDLLRRRALTAIIVPAALSIGVGGLVEYSTLVVGRLDRGQTNAAQRVSRQFFS